MEKDSFASIIENNGEETITSNNGTNDYILNTFIAKEVINNTINTKLSLRKTKLNKIFFERRILQSDSSDYPFKELLNLNINSILSLEQIKSVLSSIEIQSPISIYQSISSLRKATSNDLIGVNGFLQSNISIQITIFNILEKVSQKQSSINNYSSCDINIIYESLWLIGNLFCINNNPLFTQIKESNFTLVLISLLYFPNDTIAYQTIFCLCNMIPEDKYFIDVMFHNGAFEKVVKMLKEINIKKDKAINVLEFINNCIKSKRSFDDISSCLQSLSNQLESYDSVIQFKALQIIVRLSSMYNTSGKMIIQTGCLKSINSILANNTQFDKDTVLLSLTLVINLTAEDNDKQSKAKFNWIYLNIIRILKDDISYNDIIEKALLSLINISDNFSMVNELIANDDGLTDKIVQFVFPVLNEDITYITLSLIHSLFVLDLFNYNRLLIYKGICVKMIALLNNSSSYVNSLIISACLLVKIINWANISKEEIAGIYRQIEENCLEEIIERYLLMDIDKRFLSALNQLYKAIKEVRGNELAND